MATMKNHKYNGAIDRMNITPEQTHYINNGQGILKCHDLFKDILPFMRNADYVVVDPPWEKGNLKCFYTKADKKLDNSFEEFIDRIFYLLVELDVNSCYMEMGKRELEHITEKMRSVFPNVRVIESKYYNKYPCYFVIGEKEGYQIELEDVVKDELKVIEEIISKKNGTVLDFCLGRGAVSRYAYKNNKKFIGTELNINRLAVSLEDIKKMGGVIESK